MCVCVCVCVCVYTVTVCAPACVVPIQSWGACNFTWIPLAQRKLPTLTSTNPDFGPLKTQGYAAAAAAGYTEGVNFDGLMIMYYVALAGPFSFGGGWGEVNGLTEYMVRSSTTHPATCRPLPRFLGISVRRPHTALVPGTPALTRRRLKLLALPLPHLRPRGSQSMPLDFAVARHEIGHNFGHPHHHSNKYYWRLTRGTPEDWFDGFDMMSGGNGYEVSHFNPLSKWCVCVRGVCPARPPESERPCSFAPTAIPTPVSAPATPPWCVGGTDGWRRPISCLWRLRAAGQGARCVSPRAPFCWPPLMTRRSLPTR